MTAQPTVLRSPHPIRPSFPLPACGPVLRITLPCFPPHLPAPDVGVFSVFLKLRLSYLHDFNLYFLNVKVMWRKGQKNAEAQVLLVAWLEQAVL